MDVLLLLAEVKTSLGVEGRGDFFRDAQGRLSRPAPGETAPYVYTGVGIMKSSLFEGCPLEPFRLAPFFFAAAERGRLFGLPLKGRWLHVGARRRSNRRNRFTQRRSRDRSAPRLTRVHRGGSFRGAARFHHSPRRALSRKLFARLARRARRPRSFARLRSAGSREGQDLRADAARGPRARRRTRAPERQPGGAAAADPAARRARRRERPEGAPPVSTIRSIRICRARQATSSAA